MRHKTHTQQCIHLLKVSILCHHEHTQEMKVSSHCSQSVGGVDCHWQEVQSNCTLVWVVKTVGKLQGESRNFRQGVSDLHQVCVLEERSYLLAEFLEEGVVQRLGDRGHFITEDDGALWGSLTALQDILQH